MERRDEPAVWSGRFVGDQAQTAVLIRRDGLGQTRHKLVVVVAAHERLGDRAGEETRRWVVVEYPAGLANQTDDEVAARRWRGRRARRQEDERESAEERRASGQISAASRSTG